ncbi:MAG: HEPN domain-containing protein [Solirubrobacteraceae bacterium]
MPRSPRVECCMPPHDRLDLARVLLARAVDDETLVRKVSSDTDIADAIVGFHAQQAVEKLIKAVLAARGVGFMKSHALSYLVGVVEETRSRLLKLSPRPTCSPHGQSSSATRERSRRLSIGPQPSRWWSRCERGPRTRSKPQITRPSPSNNSSNKGRTPLLCRGSHVDQKRERRGSNPRSAPPIEIRARNGSAHGQSRLAES